MQCACQCCSSHTFSISFVFCFKSVRLSLADSNGEVILQANNSNVENQRYSQEEIPLASWHLFCPSFTLKLVRTTFQNLFYQSWCQ